jgi:hypothetical protein
MRRMLPVAFPHFYLKSASSAPGCNFDLVRRDVACNVSGNLCRRRHRRYRTQEGWCPGMNRTVTDSSVRGILSSNPAFYNWLTSSIYKHMFHRC